VIYFSDFGGGGGTAEYLGTEDTAGGSFTTATSDVLTLSGSTLKASTDYFLFASADVSVTATSFNPGLQVLNGASALYDQTSQFQFVGAGDSPRSLFFMRKVTTSASPSGDSWKLRLTGDGTNTVTWDNARIVLIEVGTNDKYAESRSRQTWTSPTSATAQTAVSLNFTPPSSGRYLILGFLNGDIGTSATHVIELTDGTNTTGEIPIYTVSAAAERVPAVAALELTLSASTTFTLKARNDSGSATLGVADACIIAIRLDRFANAYGAARSNGNSRVLTTYGATPAWVTFTPNAADHLTLAFGSFRNNSAGAATVEFDDGGTIVSEPAFRPNYQPYNSPFFSARIVSYSAAQRTQKIDHKSAVTGVTTLGPSIFTLDLGGGSSTGSGSVAVRGHAIASSSGSSLSLTLPAGSAAGDCVILFTGHGFAPSGNPTGFTQLDYQAGTNWNGGTWIKLLDSADITAGSVSISYGGSFNGVRSCIVFQGTPRLIRAFTSSRNGSGASSRALTTDSTPRSGDYFIGFGSGRANNTVTCDTGSSLRTVSATSASGVLNGGSVGSNGAITATFSYSTTPTGDYQVVLIVSP
jgi:hypothetical protein